MSTAQPPPGASRPGGRTARTRQAVLDAVFEELGEGGYAALTMEGVARRSGVHVATIYRRWRSVEGLVCELMADLSGGIPLPDTGTLRGDLRALARSIAAFYTEPRYCGLLEAVVSAAARQPEAAEVLRQFFDERLRLAGAMVPRAAARGELPEGADPDEVVAALGAPFYYRLLIARRPVDLRLADCAAEAAWAAARAGVFAPAAGAEDSVRGGAADAVRDSAGPVWDGADPVRDTGIAEEDPGKAEEDPGNAEQTPGNAEGGR
ncbi:TetR family transcriptional regulator [Streptomyces chrestomyceticus JCM 4735]|uniref:TetR family transcriptional regulator n=1 Tax=Streptomyces chrestomyceticus JCM 4735 TaxID=1306181 RepID=A0A7U9KWR9_9ACTN|nr:TetR/AcrR family transcriptional regulator [Streptomyces chrestomyceticus]GCD36241.1 TetR family transcriptional regulator [Streptomyces chrestomyceticus JCM 4735]